MRWFTAARQAFPSGARLAYLEATALDRLRGIAAEAGVPLRERLPVYARYLPADLRPGASKETPLPGPSG